MAEDPPFHETYKTLFHQRNKRNKRREIVAVEEEAVELPMIDLSRLFHGDAEERERCKDEMSGASMEWGFFQVVNHGISRDLLEKMRREQVKIFRQPFEKKMQAERFFKFSEGSYRWGTPTANCLSQLSWSEAFHVPIADISASRNSATLSVTMELFTSKLGDLAQRIAENLAEKLGRRASFFRQNCLPDTCYLRMNRYPPCPIPLEIYGLMPHTDSDFLTILHQDEVGGLQLVKDQKWIAVKPNPDALIINIGDLFQAWSNDVYKSVEHRVMTSPTAERFSTAYFFCPSQETVIKSGSRYQEEEGAYREFSFGEYRRQVQTDVQNLGRKVGLLRFRN